MWYTFRYGLFYSRTNCQECPSGGYFKVDEAGKIMGLEVWRARTNVFSELLKYMDRLKEVRVGI